MKIVDSDKGTLVEFEKILTPEEKEVLQRCLSLYQLELKELDRTEEIDAFLQDIKKGRWERFLESRKRESTVK